MSLRFLVELIFWLSALALLYAFAGYLLLLLVVSRLRPRKVRLRSITPSVSLVITAYNEERDLAEKLENSLALDYPRELLEIIVASDCSTDRTDDIAREFAARGVRLHVQPQRLGKTAAQNAAVERASGEIVVFSDATTLYQPDVLRVLMQNFADSTVGCATGRVAYVDPANSSIGHGTRSYWSYEFLLKKYESSVRSLIGVCGCLYAVRRSAYVPLYHEACSDFIIATKMVEQGLRAVYEPLAVCTEATNRRADKELRARVRIITQTFSDLWHNRAMLNPFRSGFYAVELFSHKVMRYLAPFFLMTMFATSVWLAPRPFYLFAAAAQLGVYGAAMLAWALEIAGLHSRWLALAQYFVLANLASLIGFYKFLSGERYTRWETVRTNAGEESRATWSNGPLRMRSPLIWKTGSGSQLEPDDSERRLGPVRVESSREHASSPKAV